MGVMVLAIVFTGAVALKASKAAAADGVVTMTLKYGMNNMEVKYLQQTLNEKGFRVDGISAGSPGLETTFFGNATKSAVIAFQASKGLAVDGVFGPMSRAALYASVSVVPAPVVVSMYPEGCSSNVGFSTTTGFSCAAVSSYPAGCSSNVGFSGTTGQSCAVLTSYPAGCSAGTLYSTTTGMSCAGTPAPVVSASTEGSIAVSYDAVPANNLAINKGESKVAFGIKVKATGSDMNVNRVWVNLTAGTISPRIWLAADTATLLDGSTLLGEISLSAGTVNEVTVGSEYQLQFNGLNFVVPAGTTKVLSVRFSRPTLTTNSGTILIAANGVSVRAIDGTGLSEAQTISATRTLNFANVAALNGTVTASLDSGSPVIKSVAGISATAGVLTPVKLMDVKLTSADGPINVYHISGTITASGCTAVECLSAVELRDGSTVLDSVTGAATFAFDDLSIDIATDGSKVLSIWGQVNPISATLLKGEGVYATVDDVDATTGTTFADVSIAPSVVGNYQYFFQYAPTLALNTAGTTVEQVEGSAVGKKAINAALSFTVTAPLNSDIYVNATDGLICGGTYPVTKIGNAACNSATIGGTMAAATVTVSGSSSKGTGTLATWDKVAAGTSRTFTLEGYIPDGNAAGMTGMTMATNGLQWTDTDNVTIVGTDTIEQTWGLTDFKTGTKYVTS